MSGAHVRLPFPLSIWTGVPPSRGDTEFADDSAAWRRWRPKNSQRLARNVLSSSRRRTTGARHTWITELRCA